MIDWRFTAGLLAITLVAIASVGVWRYTRPVMFVWIGLLIAIPAAGFAAYALVPGPVPDLRRPFWLVAFIPTIAALVATVWIAIWMVAQRRALQMRSLQLASIGMLVTFEGIVLAISDVMTLWEPGFAAANIALNAAWVLVWIPRRLRTTEARTAVEIAAPRGKVFAFLANPGNWPLYQEGTLAAEARPAGPLAAGSEIVTQRTYSTPVRGPRFLPTVLETHWLVTWLEPDAGIAMTMTSQPPQNETAFRFTDSAAGTRLDVRATGLVPYRLAVLGVVIENSSTWSERMAIANRNLARLKGLLEEPTSAG